VTVHPIEQESYRILASRLDLDRWPPLSRAVVARVVHAAADVALADTLVLDEATCAAGVAALRAGAPVVADVEMVAVAARWPEGAVVVVGNAPTALFEVVRLAAAGSFAPALVIGLPVGFVGAADSKAALRESGLPAISNVGERGGSAVAAAALNALHRLAVAEP
jgi:precorrin-8X/cobalt-precorrin-8 methylmutase